MRTVQPRGAYQTVNSKFSKICWPGDIVIVVVIVIVIVIDVAIIVAR